MLAAKRLSAESQPCGMLRRFGRRSALFLFPSTLVLLSDQSVSLRRLMMIDDDGELVEGESKGSLCFKLSMAADSKVHVVLFTRNINSGLLLKPTVPTINSIK